MVQIIFKTVTFLKLCFILLIDYVFEFELMNIILDIITSNLCVVLTCIVCALLISIRTITLLIIKYNKYNLYQKINKHTHTCSICLNDINISNYIELKCKHQFHNACIDNWFIRKRSCPNCRYVIH